MNFLCICRYIVHSTYLLSSPSPKSKVPKSRPKGLGLTLKSLGPGGQQDQGFGVVLHVQEEVYQSNLNFRKESSQVPRMIPLILLELE